MSGHIPAAEEAAELSWEEMQKKKKMTLYICGVDWQHELGEASHGTKFYPSVECLKKHKYCWDECGIIKVNVTFDDIEWVEPQVLLKDKR